MLQYSRPGRIFYRCVDWNSVVNAVMIGYFCRIFYRCVDWNKQKWRLICLSTKSHLLQMRGLKPVVGLFTIKDERVASFTDAWIETWLYCTCYWCLWSHLLQMRGLKLSILNKRTEKVCRIFYRCVDWNRISLQRRKLTKSRIFYRCVDWNIKILTRFYPITESHLLQMRGLKLERLLFGMKWCKSHLLQMRGLKQKPILIIRTTRCRIFYRCVDWNKWYEKSIKFVVLSHLLQMRGLKP